LVIQKKIVIFPAVMLYLRNMGNHYTFSTALKKHMAGYIGLILAAILIAGIAPVYAQNTPDDNGLKQMGAFKSRANAAKLAAKLTEAGSITTVKEKAINAETYFVVYVQPAKPSSAKHSAKPSAGSKGPAEHRQLASFLKLDNAQTLAKEHQDTGKDVFICKKKVKKDTYYRVYEKAPGSAGQPCAQVGAEPLEMASATPMATPPADTKPVAQKPTPKPGMQKIEKLDMSIRFFINQDAVVYKDNKPDAQQTGLYSDFGGGLVLGTVEDWYVVRFQDKSIGYISPSDVTKY